MTNIKNVYMMIRRNFFMDDEEDWHPADLAWLGVLAVTLLFWLGTLLYTW